MPIGKNSIKRVANGARPEAVTPAPAPETVALAQSAAESKPAAPKSEPQKPSRGKVGRPRKTESEAKKAAPAAKEPSVKEKAEKKAKTPTKKPDGFVRVSLGDELPTHLL